MSKTKCIFKPQRCKDCDNLILTDESKHVCKEKPSLRFPHSRRLDLEIFGAFKFLRAKSLRPSEITKYLKSEYPEREYDQFHIKWHMKTLPKIYAVDPTIKQSKYAEKYYLHLLVCSTPQRNRIEKDRTLGYHIQPPRSEWGLTYSIKKTILEGDKKKETTLAMVYGEKLAKELLKKCKEIQA